MAASFSLPKALEVKTSAEMGRGLYAREAVPEGQELMRVQPIAHVVKDSRRERVCQRCLGETK